MRALLIIAALLLGQLSYGQDQTTPPTATTPTTSSDTSSTDVPVATADGETETTDAVVIPSAFKAGWFASPSFTMMKRDLSDNDATGVLPFGAIDESVTMIDLGAKGGYVFEFGLFAGLQAMYTMGKSKAGGVSNDITSYGLGPSIGYSEKYTGFFITATYFLIGKTDFDAAGEFDEMTGLQVDLSYPMNLTENIKIGPQLTWKRLKNSDHSVPGTQDYKTKDFAPSISAWFYF